VVDSLEREPTAFKFCNQAVRPFRVLIEDPDWAWQPDSTHFYGPFMN